MFTSTFVASFLPSISQVLLVLDDLANVHAVNLGSGHSPEASKVAWQQVCCTQKTANHKIYH